MARAVIGARRPASAPALPSLAAVAIVSALLSACTPSPPADPTGALRADTLDEGEGDADAEARPRFRRAAPASGELVWLSSETEALRRSREERRPVLVHFGSPWCADCKRMDRETFGDPRVKEQAGRFLAVRIEATNDEDPQVSAALQKYTVINVPTLILLDSRGHEQRRFTELVGPETLLHEIDRVR